MKRDMDLVRTLLLHIEAKTPPRGYIDLKEGDVQGEWEWAVVVQHLRIMDDAGLILRRDSDIGGTIFRVNGLSWSGHDFADALRDEELWRKTKIAMNKASGITWDLVKAIAVGFLKKQLEVHTGVAL